MVEKLTGCFAQTSLGLPELGIGTAEEDVVIEAWKLHMTLIKNSKRYRRYADWAYLLSLLLSLAAAFLSVYWSIHMMSECAGKEGGAKEENCRPDDHILHVMKYALLIIPLIAGALGAYISRTRYLQKWGQTLTSAGHMVAEIYKFRCHINEYNPISSQGQTDEEAEADKKAVLSYEADEEEGAGEAGGANDARNPRKVGGFADCNGGPRREVWERRRKQRSPQIVPPRKFSWTSTSPQVFVRNVQEIFANVIEALGDDAMMESWNGKSTVDDVGNQQFKHALRAHVPRTVLRSGPYYAKNGKDITWKTPKTLAKLEGIAGVGVANAAKFGNNLGLFTGGQDRLEDAELEEEHTV